MSSIPMVSESGVFYETSVLSKAEKKDIVEQATEHAYHTLVESMEGGSWQRQMSERSPQRVMADFKKDSTFKVIFRPKGGFSQAHVLVWVETKDRGNTYFLQLLIPADHAFAQTLMSLPIQTL